MMLGVMVEAIEIGTACGKVADMGAVMAGGMLGVMLAGILGGMLEGMLGGKMR